MMRSRFLRCGLTFYFVISAVGACRMSASPKSDQAVPAVKQPLVAAEPPPDASRSKWINENWNLLKTALIRAGLSPVQLDPWHPQYTRMNDPSAPWRHFGPDSGCEIIKNEPGAPPRLLHNSTGLFAVSEGKLYCLVVDYQSLGNKQETLAGAPRNCGGGAYQEANFNYHLYVIPEGVAVGGVRTVRAPSYDLDIRYEEQCPQVPSARF